MKGNGGAVGIPLGAAWCRVESATLWAIAAVRAAWPSPAVPRSREPVLLGGVSGCGSRCAHGPFPSVDVRADTYKYTTR